MCVMSATRVVQKRKNFNLKMQRIKRRMLKIKSKMRIKKRIVHLIDNSNRVIAHTATLFPVICLKLAVLLIVLRRELIHLRYKNM